MYSDTDISLPLNYMQMDVKDEDITKLFATF
jgi:hypothetical protein